MKSARRFSPCGLVLRSTKRHAGSSSNTWGRLIRRPGASGTFRYYSSVDEKAQVIVGQHVSQQANDYREVSPALDEVEATTGRAPDTTRHAALFSDRDESGQSASFRV